MQLLWIILLAFLLLLLAVWLKIAVLQKRKQVLQKQLTGLKFCSALKTLLVNLQQHRGMMNAFLKGDQSFKVKIVILQKEIDIKLGQITDRALYGEFVSKIEKEWQSLQENAFRFQVGVSFTEHCRLIDSVLDLLNDAAEQNQLSGEKSYPVEYVDIIWRLLPMSAEALGRARAVGSGIAAAGGALAVDRVRLVFLINKIGTAMQEVKEKSAQVVGKDLVLDRAINNVDKDLNNFLKDMEKQLLQLEKPMITSTAFFNEATNMLTAVYSLYEQGESMAVNSVNVSVEMLDGSIKFAYGSFFAISGLMAVAYFL